MATTESLSATVANLKTQLAGARNQPPDLSRLSGADLVVLASEAAVGILRVARSASTAIRAESERCSVRQNPTPKL